MYLYKLHDLNGLSLEQGAELKVQAYHDYSKIETGLYHARRDYENWVKKIHESNTLRSRLAKLIGSRDAAAVPVALRLIDVLTSDMIYLKLYGAAQAGFTDQEFDAVLRDCPYIPDPVLKEKACENIWDCYASFKWYKRNRVKKTRYKK